MTTWLCAIAKNLYISHLRKEKRRADSEPDDIPAETDISGRMEQTEIYKAMERNLTENAANVYIQDMADMVAVRRGLTGLAFYPIYVLDLSTVRYEG